MRYLIILMMTVGLMLVGCQADEAEEPETLTEEAAEALEEGQEEAIEAYEEAMRTAEDDEAEIRDLIEGGPEADSDDAVERLWQRAIELAEEARERSEAAWETAQEEGDHAVEEAREAAGDARERARMAWEEASEFSGEAWADFRERADAAWEEAEAAWARIAEDENDDNSGD